MRKPDYMGNRVPDKEIDGMPDIPDELDDLDYRELRELGTAYSLGRAKSEDQLKHDLKRVRDDDGMVIKCPNPECGRVWVYTGEAFKVATCTSCFSSVTIDKNRKNKP